MSVTRRKRRFPLANLVVEVGYKDQVSSTIAGYNEATRPTLGPTMEVMRPAIRQAGAAMVRAVNRGKSPLPAARELAEDLEDELRRQIDEAQPGNAPSTIARKGFDDPLRGPSRPGQPGDRIYEGVTSKVSKLGE